MGGTKALWRSDALFLSLAWWHRTYRISPNEKPIATMKNLQHLVCFVTVVDAGSFTQAAQILGASKSWVSRCVSSLEDQLGARLLYRTTRRCSLTEAGTLLYQDAKHILELSEGAISAISTASREVSGVVRISSPATLGENYIMPLLQPLLTEYPRLSLEMHFDDYNVDLIAPGYDLIVRHGFAHDSAHVARKLGEIPVILVANPEYLKRRGVPREPKDLDSHDCVMVHRVSRQLYNWNIVHAQGTKPSHLFRPSGRVHIFGQLDTCKTAAVNGLGISFTEPRSVLPLLQSGRLRVVLPEYRVRGEFDDTVVQLIYPHRTLAPKKVRIFIDLIAADAFSWSTLEYNPADFSAVGLHSDN
jgi:DNA-binding transcriptional LysR family regulator